MWKIFSAGATAAFFSITAWCADLSATESRWLKGVWPVVLYAREIRLPLDIVVQPQPTPGQAPLAMAFVDGRCKLVFSMRGNPEAATTLERIAPALLDASLELMAAHELGHCQRYLQGAWYSLPAGFTQRSGAGRQHSEMRAAVLEMKAARREEGFADLVALAWIKQRRPKDYAALHAWLVEERSRDLVPGSHHDTLVWIRLVADGSGLVDKPIFSGAASVWTEGLTADNR